MKDKEMFTQNKEFKATCIRALWIEHSDLKSEVICKRVFRWKAKSVGRLKSLRGSAGSTVRVQSTVDHLQGVGARIRFLYDVMSTAASASEEWLEKREFHHLLISLQLTTHTQGHE